MASVFERASERLVVVGHRGGRENGYVENTCSAFERAIHEGADAIELDVRLCATGEVVVFHDPTLARATNDTDAREVRDVPYVELGSMKLFGGSQGAPLLRDIITLCADRGVALNIEAKYDMVDQPKLAAGIAREIDRDDRADVIVSSFDPRMLAAFRATRVGARTRLAIITTDERWWSLPLARVAARKPLLYSVHLERKQARPKLVSRLKSRGLRVGVWTVNDPAEARELRAMGVDWVITDAPRSIPTG